MNNMIGDTERTLANVIRAAGLQADESLQPPPAVADWPGLVDSARNHSVQGLLYSALTRTGAIALAPKDQRELLRQAYLRTLALNSRKLGVFAELAGELNALGVPVIALKGCALATTLYGDAGQRFIGDIDFLVRREHIPAVVQVISRHGFRPYENVFDDTTRDELLGELVFVRLDTPPVFIEPHWHIFSSPYFVRHVPVNWFWDNAQPAQFGNQTALVLNSHALILHLCSHYVVHHIGRPHLRWSYDIALLLAHQRDAINWPALVEAARRFDLFGVLQRVLAYVVDLWAVTLDSAQHAQVFGLQPTARERVITRALTSESIRPIVDGLMAGGRSQRMQYLRDVFFPSGAYMRMRYGNEVQGPLLRFYIRRLGNGLRRFAGMPASKK